METTVEFYDSKDSTTYDKTKNYINQGVQRMQSITEED